MMTPEQLNELAFAALDAYQHAIAKHPKFVQRTSHQTIDMVEVVLENCRAFNDSEKSSFKSIFDEEILEYLEASLIGDKAAAKRELLDCFAVLMREWERINK